MQPARLAAATRLLAAGASGVLLAASQPPGGLAALVWLALAPLIVAARRAAGVREALRLGLFAGAVMMASGFPWFVYLVRTFAQLDLWLSLTLFALWCLWSAVPVALWAALVHLLTRPAGGRRWAAVAGALAFPGIWWAWPAVFPFTIVLGLAAEPAWIQAAELGGVAAVEALALLAAGLLADAVAAAGWPARLRRLALALAVPGLAWGLGAARMRGLDAETVRTVRFGVVQPNNPLYWPDKQARLERLREPSAAAEAAGAEVVVWPENQYPWPLDRPLLRDFTDDDRVLRRHRLPTLFGAGSIADADAYGYNSAYHLGADGEVRGTFDKVHLVPIGETIPLLDPDWVTSRINGLSHNFAGSGPARFVVEPGPPGASAPPLTVGPLICYEDVVAGFVRAVAGQPGGVEVFVNLTNDSWFGPGSEAWEHLALAQFRSVEHRVPMVRSVNTGPSSVIDRSGRVVAGTTLRPADVDALVPPEQLVVDVAIGRDTASAPTVYARGGWLLVHLCQALAVGLTLVLLRARRR